MSDPALDRRRRAVLAGWEDDEASVRDALVDDDPLVRAAAIGALARLRALRVDDLAGAVLDLDPPVRRRAAEELARCPAPGGAPLLLGLLDDDDDAVVEAAAFAAGERHGAVGATDRDPVEAAPPGLREALVAVARDHDDPLAREAAVAALGAIGDPDAVEVVVAATTGDRPAVRRRAVIALAAFEGPEVTEALQRALEDRDWQVREAAAALLDDA